MPTPNETLAAFFVAHGVVLSDQGEWMNDGSNPTTVRARFTRETTYDSGTTMLQLEVDARLPDGRIINECFAGWAESRDDAESDASETSQPPAFTSS